MRAACLLLLLFAPGSFAYEFPATEHVGKGLRVTLRSGAIHEGIYRGGRGNVLLMQVDGGVSEIDMALVTSALTTRTPLEEFLEKRKLLKPGDFSGSLDLAEWASQRGLIASANREARKVLSADPRNSRARSFLGIKKAGETKDPPAPAAPPAPMRKGPLQTGESVTVEYDEEKSVSGSYGGKKNGQVRILIPGGEIFIADASIKSITRIDPLMSDYFNRKAVVGGDDAAGWWELALWCRNKGLRDEAIEAANTVLAIMPGHRAAAMFIDTPNWPATESRP
ncbi:MAG: hypothetical protein M0D55_10840 [Elusimicrobiota bacterium]|nr:MAG: hypothetical protein M0D55_10840 [Elusimicrobiota bacterium]